jgi:hypothetical protein
VRGGVEPVPASSCQDDSAARCSCGVSDRIEQDSGHGEVFISALTVGCVSMEDDRAYSHHQRRDGADNEHRQAVDVPRTGDEAVSSCDGDEQLEC